LIDSDESDDSFILSGSDGLLYAPGKDKNVTTGGRYLV